MSAPSYRSRSMVNALDQIISSGEQIGTDIPRTSARIAWWNQSSSTGTAPLPALWITSTKLSSWNALPSHKGQAISVR